MKVPNQGDDLQNIEVRINSQFDQQMVSVSIIGDGGPDHIRTVLNATLIAAGFDITNKETT